jgi:type I restriction enzyme S subunit
MSKEKLIPEIRFPDFKNEAQWDIEQLGVLSEIVRGGSPRPIEDYFTTDVNGLNWLKIADVPSDAKYITQTKEKVKKEALSSTREVNSGDLILSNSMSFGRPYILKITTCIHDGWIAIREISNKTFEDYLYYFISSESSQSYFQTNAAGAAVKNLNAEIIKLLPIYLPKNKKEQQKIAACLSSLDEVIASHSQKLEILKEHKKGLMQTLFPSADEKVPKYRFKEFEKDGEWVVKKLGTIGDPLMCKRILKEQTTSNSKDGIPFYKIGTFGKEADAYIPIELYEEFKNKYSFPNAGDILISASGTIGRLVVYDGLPAYFQDSNIVWLGNNEELVLNDFLYHCYSILKWQTSDGGIISRLYNSDLKNIGFKFPKVKAEQQKIASCLSSLDALITDQAEKIEQLKLHKKGLMQGLFPKK